MSALGLANVREAHLVTVNGEKIVHLARTLANFHLLSRRNF
jgi:hypothetical protein